VGDRQGFPDEQTVWAAWADEANGMEEDAKGIAFEDKKCIYSPEQTIGWLALGHKNGK
jgi:hypothetical protein